ncbi:Aste57867_3796 [Aphanomyces stellatus]|nr:hypothetical protein As57867_003785 [Aphanomyces stellatus]VFT80946.1 Aste57867_3796 [Aphanomyces stellatus]
MLQRVQTILAVVEGLLPGGPDSAAINSLTQSGSSIGSSNSSNSMLNSPVSSLVQEKGKPGDALVLAMKCLHLLHMVVTQDEAKRPWIKALLAQCIDKAEQSKKWLAADTTQLASFEEIIYTHVMRLGREAAVHEVLGQKAMAAELYGRAQLLLESMLLSAKKLQTDDRQRLVGYLDAFKQRLAIVYN